MEASISLAFRPLVFSVMIAFERRESMWHILGSYPFSQAGLHKRYEQAKQLLLWESAGWTRKDLKNLAKRDLQLSDFCIGSQAFNLLWQDAYATQKPSSH